MDLQQEYQMAIEQMQQQLKAQQERIEQLEKENKQLLERAEIAEDSMLRDGMTGLYSKKGIKKYFTDQLNQTDHVEKMESCYVVEVDMDNFKDINDSYNHLVGDEAIKIVSFALLSMFESKDLVVRSGGDEFLVFIKNIPEEILLDKLEDVRTGVTMSLHRLLDSRGKDLGVDRGDKNYGLSIGYAPMDLSRLDQNLVSNEQVFTDTWLNPQLAVCDELLSHDKADREARGLRHKR